MAASSSTSAAFQLPNISHIVYVKLEGPNYLQWLSQMNPALRTHEFMSFVDGSEPCPSPFLPDSEGKETLVANPDHALWHRKDQFLLSWINATLAEKVLSTVYGMTTSRQVWSHLAKKFASQSKSHIAHLKRQLQSLHQGSKSCTEFLQAALANQLAVAGKPLDDDDLISFIISGLNNNYTGFVTVMSFSTRNSNISFDDFETELLSHELLLESHHHSVPPSPNTFAMYSNKSSSSKRFGNRKPKGSFSSHSRYSPPSNQSRPQAQVSTY
jgi:hypothetical protein